MRVGQIIFQPCSGLSNISLQQSCQFSQVENVGRLLLGSVTSSYQVRKMQPVRSRYGNLTSGLTLSICQHLSSHTVEIMRVLWVERMWRWGQDTATQELRGKNPMTMWDSKSDRNWETQRQEFLQQHTAFCYGISSKMWEPLEGA